MEFKIPSQQTVIEIHKIVIEEYGGRDGTLHADAIESAIYRPQNYMAYAKHCDIHLVGAILLHSIASNHVFVDGNKRTALITTLMMYNLNDVRMGYDLMMNKRFERLVLDVVEKKLGIAQIRRRLRILVKTYMQV